MSINDGGPAFPNPALADESFCPSYDMSGMSLRDWFAGQAFSQAVEDYGQPDVMKSSGQRRDRGNPILPYAHGLMTREEIIAGQAYRYADAMLAARQEPPHDR